MFTPKDHDLALPDWGPYSKNYAGASHIADRHQGLRFDYSVFPALYRRRIDVPNVTWESGWHPWQCAPTFEYFSFRHELVWKDKLYADISYFQIQDNPAGAGGVFVRCEFVNAGPRPVPVALHAMASLSCPTGPGVPAAPLRQIEVSQTADASGNSPIIKHPLDYDDLDFAVAAPADKLVPDGLLRGEVRGHDFLDGSGLGGRFGRDAGDTATYTFTLSKPIDNARLTLRLRGSGEFHLNGFGFQQKSLSFDCDEFKNLELDVGSLSAGAHTLRLTAAIRQPDVFLALLALSPAASCPLEVVKKTWSPRPERLPVEMDSSHGAHLILRYPNVATCYGIAWDAADIEVRQIANDELDGFLRYKAHDHVSETLTGNDGGHYTNVFIRPLQLAAKSRMVVWGLVCEGAADVIRCAFKDFASGYLAERSARREALYRRARRRAFAFKPNPTGRAFAFSQERMAATTLSNIVFPVYTQRQNVRHRPPGRWWNSLYTWDSGFIGLGLLEIDPAQAWDNLSQYLTAPGNPHAAFIQHGSLVPMQIHLAHEAWNRTRDMTALRKNYGALRQYYRFLAGRADGSTLRSLQSGLLRSWDYFYNSGGWDDYPPQQRVHNQKLTARATPVITTALAIRCAKTLCFMARALGQDTAGDDIADYEADIATFRAALEQHSWDEVSGYYAYVVHDSEGRPAYHLRHEASGANYNMGLDGLFPLVADIGDSAHQDRLVERLFDPARLWTSIGLSAVDRTAPYYRHDGYWSGTVWFPHQWFFWKTMLDHGRVDHALAIAQRALETWRAEVDESYHCFEHFLIETERGCGWHQFSGLSTPVMIFYAACHCPGHLTVGFDAWVKEAEFSGKNTRFDGEILFPSSNGNAVKARSVLLCMKAGHQYQVAWNGHPQVFTELVPGLLGITLEIGNQCESAKLTVQST
jgi:hypothetical protein